MKSKVRQFGRMPSFSGTVGKCKLSFWREMRKFVLPLLTLVLVLGVVSANATTVTIPDPDPEPFIFFGNGDASVTYDGVMFVQQASIGTAALFNIGHLLSDLPAVLSSQRRPGLDNILIMLPNATTSFSVDYGTFDGSSVTFLLSNGHRFTQSSTGNETYDTPDLFSITDTPFTSVLVTSEDSVMNINHITYEGTTPEPGTLVMFGSAIVAAVSAMHRRLSA